MTQLIISRYRGLNSVVSTVNFPEKGGRTVDPPSLPGTAA